MWMHVFDINGQLVAVKEYSYGKAEEVYKAEFTEAKIDAIKYIGVAKVEQ